MAIQNRRGVYSDFTPSKMVPGELAVVQSGDPNNTSGKAVYAAFGASGDVKRLASEDDLSGKVDKVTGKGLSTNDYTTAEKNKLSGIEAQANKTVIDSTLTQTGQAADAKAVGDAIDSVTIETDKTLTEEDVPADAKVVGDEFASVKSDLSLLEADLEGESEIRENISFVYGYYINLRDGTTVNISTPVADQRYKYAIVDCSAGDKFLINAYGGSAPRAYGFVDSNNVKLYVSDADTNILNQTVTAPANSAKIIINDRFSESSDLMSYKIIETEGIGENFVRFDKTQDKTDEEKALARANIGIGDISGLSEEAKEALLACFRNVVWINWEESGQSYYDALAEALDVEPTPPAPSFDYGVYEPEEVINGKYIDATGEIQNGITNQSYYIADYIPVVRSSYWIGYQPPLIKSDAGTVWSESNWRVSEYNDSKQFIKQTAFSGSSGNGKYSSRIITFDSNTKYIRLGWYDGYANAEYIRAFDIENPTLITELPMESGDINASTGQNATNSLRIRTTGYIPMTGSTITLAGCPFAPTWTDLNQYTAVGVRCYDSSKNYLGNVQDMPNADTTKSLLANTAYIRMIIQASASWNFSDFKYMVGYLYTINGVKYYVTGV